MASPPAEPDTEPDTDARGGRRARDGGRAVRWMIPLGIPLLTAAGILAAPYLVAGCSGKVSSDSSGASAPAGGPSSNGTGSGTTTASGSGVPGTPGGGNASASGSGGSSAPTPPEVEAESAYEAPIATGRFVWIANPRSGRVAYVDASTLAVDSVEAGNAPTYVAPVPGAADAVIVLNVLSRDATYLRATTVPVAATTSSPATTATKLTSVMIPHLSPRANAWAVSVDGRWALAWADARRVAAASIGGVLAPADELEGFQDVTVIDLAAAPPVATTVAVGYRPVSIAFSDDVTRAFAVTADGVSVIALPAAAVVGGAAATVPKVIRDVPIDSGLSSHDAALGTDVSISSASGVNRAVVRRDGFAEVRVVNLDSGDTVVLALDGPATDLDVTPDGSKAVAVVRQSASVYVIPLGAGAPTPDAVAKTTIAGAIIGSVVLTADNATAILYSNAIASDRLEVLDLATGASHELRTHAGVLSVFPTPDANYAVVLHRDSGTGGTGTGGAGTGGAGTGGAAGGSSGGGGATDLGPPPPPPRPGKAFSIIPLDGSRSGRIQGTEAVPQSIGVGPASDRVLVTIRDDAAAVYAVYVASIPSLEVQRFALASPPTVAGVVAAAARGYVSQEHPEGRITFIPFDGTSLRTITGFELGARVVDGVSP
jgi:hypothetical protein